MLLHILWNYLLPIFIFCYNGFHFRTTSNFSLATSSSDSEGETLDVSQHPEATCLSDLIVVNDDDDNDESDAGGKTTPRTSTLPSVGGSATERSSTSRERRRSRRRESFAKLRKWIPSGMQWCTIFPKKPEEREGREAKPPPDEDELFLMAQLLALRRLQAGKKALAKFKIHEVLLNAEHGTINERHQRPSSAIQLPTTSNNMNNNDMYIAPYAQPPKTQN